MSRSLLVIVFLATQTVCSWGQSITGLAPFAPLQGSGAEIVNLANLNVHLSIPIMQKAGRGLDFHYVLSYDSTIWTIAPHSGAWAPVPNWGWRGVSEASVGYITYDYYFNPQGWPTGTNLYLITGYYDPYGTYHRLNAVGQQYEPWLCWPYAGINCETSGWLESQDGSGYRMFVSVVNNIFSVSNFTDKSGNLIVAPLINVTNGLPTNTNGPGSITDPNGNQISTTGLAFTDTLGMNVLTVSGSNPVKYTYAGPNLGSNQTTEVVKVNYSSYTVATNFGCVNHPEYPPTQVNLVSSILLADGTSYTFQYEANGSYTTGRIAQVGLPTGGSITYQYASSVNFCPTASLPGLTRTLSDGSVWQYAKDGDGSGTPTFTTVTDPAMNQTVLTISGGAAVQTKSYQGGATSGTLLQTVTTCYSAQPAPCSTPTGPPSTGAPAAITVVTLPHVGSSSKVTTYLNSNTLPTEIDSYDFGAASPTQKELITYAPLANGINNRVACDQVLIGTAVPASCGTATSNTKSMSTAGYDSLGNLLNTSSWVSGVSTPQYLNRGFQHYANGLLHIVTDVNNNQTTYGYQNCNGTQAYPSSISSGGLITSMTWDCNGGRITGITDANSQLRSFGYANQGGTSVDPFWRVLSVTDPLLNVTWNTYTATTAETALSFNSNLSGSDVLRTFDGLGRLSKAQIRTAPGSSTFDQTVQYGYGWTATGLITGPFATRTLPGGTAVTTTQLDALLRTATVTDGGGGTMALSYAQNDVSSTLGPPPSGESTKNRQLQYDALGRVTSACEILSSGGSPCGQNTTASGYITSYAYSVPGGGGSQLVTTQGAQSRTYVWDGLGRLISETNPESGTTQYFWDAAPSACLSPNGYPTPGDLGARKDNAGNYTCFGYDALHRLLGWSNTLDSNCGNLIYDVPQGTLPSGVTIANSAGRLVEAYTNSACNGKTSLVTDEYFSYSPRGEASDVYESTPHSGGYYHTSASYWANGALQSLSGIPGYTTTTYGVDGEGRPTSAQQGTTKLVCDSTCSSASTTYNAAGQVQTISIGNGSGDNDTYMYDLATGRMTSFTFTVGSPAKSFAGVLSWNANGSLGQLAITDGFHSGGTQTCNYLYDDLRRIGTPSGSSSYSVDCGSTLWRQTFTYDQYGNLTKTANPGISWQPGYNQSTNQYLTPVNCVTAGGSPCYDLNGNLLRDGSNSYTWNAYGRMTSISSGNSAAVCGTNGVCLTQDAFGRVVEENTSGTYTEILYSPMGKTANMSGASTVNYAYLPLPGGATLYSFQPGGTARYFQHKDWLGSARLESGIANRLEQYDRAFAPFGEIYDKFDAAAGVNFTGDTQDISSVLFDTPNRELHPNQGRWLSPDPAGIMVVDITRPQTWNRYSYVSNQPCDSIDVLGLSSCTLHVDIAGGNRFLSPAQIASAEQQFNKLIAPANVSATFTLIPRSSVDSSPSVAFQAELFPGQGPRGPDQNGWTVPVNVWETPGTIANIYLGSGPLQDSGTQFGLAVGTVMAHEFVAHTIGGVRLAFESSPFDSLEGENEWDASKLTNPNLAIQNSTLLGMVNQACQKLAGASGGGGTGNGGLSGLPDFSDGGLGDLIALVNSLTFEVVTHKIAYK